MTDERLPDLPRPRVSLGMWGWLRHNLFSTPLNTVLTLIALYLVVVTVSPLIQWAVIDADWSGTSRDDCAGGGACWVFVSAWLNQFLYGSYPAEQLWRVNLGFLLFALLLIPLFSKRFPYKAGFAVFTLLGFPVIAFVLFVGGSLGLVEVETYLWGGLMLTLVLAVIGIVLSLPFGILLALGRRSELPVIRAACVTYIEIWRGVPLITVLFMASVMLPLFFPEGVNPDKLLRAMIGIVLFQSAYMAEVVRGGLQAIPKGQYEAAEALGLGYWQSMSLVVMPQALKLVIPGIVNTFIALFKDTTLVMIIGLFDVLGIVTKALADPAWLGYSAEGYLFAGFIFWAFCFAMSRYSQAVERELHRSHERGQGEPG
jgi:general L-amino acid transport system permease protein